MYRRLKLEHQKPVGMFNPILILEWKWEHMAIDFVVGLLVTTERHDSIRIIEDRLIKSAHLS